MSAFATVAGSPLPLRTDPTMRGLTRRAFRRYRTVLTETLRRPANDLALPLREDHADALATSIPYWPVFGDVERSLGRLRSAGWRLALLTNCDRDLIALMQGRLPVGLLRQDEAASPEAWRLRTRRSHRRSSGLSVVVWCPESWPTPFAAAR